MRNGSRLRKNNLRPAGVKKPAVGGLREKVRSGSLSTHLADIEDWLMSAPVRERQERARRVAFHRRPVIRSTRVSGYGSALMSARASTLASLVRPCEGKSTARPDARHEFQARSATMDCSSPSRNDGLRTSLGWGERSETQ